MNERGGDGGDGVPGDLDGLLARIGEWSDDQEASAAALSRRRRHWLRQQAAESTTLVGILLTLAEREEPVTIGTAAGRQRGTVTSVTAALCTLDLDADDGGHALIPLGAITAIDGGPALVDIHDDRTAATTTDLAAALAGLAAERRQVVLHLHDATTVTGTLATVGADVVSVRARAGMGSGATHVPLDAIVSCVLGPGPG